MAQKTTGLHAVLSLPTVYEAFQQVVGSPQVRRTLADDYVRPEPGMRVLDVGCGPGDLIEYLPGVSYTGVDRSAPYIASAQRRFGSRGRFHVGSVQDLDPVDIGEFDVVIAKSLLHHIDTDEALHLFHVAGRVLAPEGRLLTVDPAYTSDMSRSARYVVSRDRGLNVRTPAAYEALARRAFADVRVRVHHDLLRIPYTHAFMSCSKPLQ